MKKPNYLSILFILAIGTFFAQVPQELKDIVEGQLSSNPWNFVDVNGTLYFQANDGVHGEELWKSDGTASGTVMVKDINQGSESSMISSLPAMINLNGVLIFGASNGTHGLEIWKSDGTAAGTIMLKDISSGFLPSMPVSFTIMNNLVYFSATSDQSGGLYKTDGTIAGTSEVVGNMSVGEMIRVGNTLFFAGGSGTSDAGEELWKSDGTAGGTVMVKDIEPGFIGSHPGGLTDVNGTLYFYANNDLGTELWKTDGTEAGTVMLKDINPGVGNGAEGGMFNLNNKLYLMANDGVNGSELWVSDGTANGTLMLKDIEAGPDGSFPDLHTRVAMNGEMYFAASTAAEGTELWKTDGTSAGTVMVKSIYPGFMTGSPTHFCVRNNMLYFSAIDEDHGRELWTSDGTATGTTLLYDLNPGPLGSIGNYLTLSNGNIFFQGSDNQGFNGVELWMLSGASALPELNQSGNLEIYPNPADGQIYLKQDIEPGAQVEIRGSEGPSCPENNINPGAKCYRYFRFTFGGLPHAA